MVLGLQDLVVSLCAPGGTGRQDDDDDYEQRERERDPHTHAHTHIKDIKELLMGDQRTHYRFNLDTYAYVHIYDRLGGWRGMRSEAHLWFWPVRIRLAASKWPASKRAQGMLF